MDSNGNRIQDSWEARGSYSGNPLNLGVGGASGINITLTDPTTDTDHDGLSDFYEVYTSHTDPNHPDTDGDGMPDGWEAQNNINPLFANADADPDIDFLSNIREYQTGSDPHDDDSDNDGLKDGVEVDTYHTNPINADTDGDHLGDYAEINTLGTDPTKADTDGDGVADDVEIAAGTDPLNPLSFPSSALSGIVIYGGMQTGTVYVYAASFSNAWTSPYWASIAITGVYSIANAPAPSNYWINAYRDSNGNGVKDAWEARGSYSGNPVHITNHATTAISVLLSDPDVDSDAMPDWWELAYFTNGMASAPTNDADSDGLQNLQEWLHGTNPTNTDSESDGLTDGAEVNTYHTDPKNTDSDGDGLSDGAEVNTHHTDPNDTDTDNDGLSDGAEVNTLNTDPNDTDTDNDGLTDGAEVNTYHTDPTKADTDGDGMPDGWEITYSLLPLQNDANLDADSDGLSNLKEYQAGSSPRNVDTDGDGLLDNYEVLLYGTDPASADSDSDGLNDWAEIHTTHTNPSKGDSDNDGSKDGDELIAGTSPTNGASVFQITRSSSATNGTSQILSWNGNTGRLYRIQSNTNLLLDTWADIAGETNLPGIGTLMSRTNATVRSPEYFRVKVKTGP